MSWWLNTNWNGKFQRDTWFELRCLHSVLKTNYSWRTQSLKTTWVQVEEMWYTQRNWTKELNTESAYRSMGGVTMAPSLPASWSSWELGGVWNHCCLHAGKRGKGLSGTWKYRNCRRKTVQQGLCPRSQGRAWSLEASLASVASRSWGNQNTQCLSVSWSYWLQTLLHFWNISQWDVWGNILVLVLNNLWKLSQKLDPNKLLSFVD